MRIARTPRTATRLNRATLALMALAPMALSACNWDRHTEYGGVTASLAPESSSHQFAWHQTELTHQVRFAPGTPMAAPDELIRLNQFIDQVGVQSNDEVSASVGGPLAQDRAGAVTQAFSLRGYRITPRIDPYGTDGDVIVTIRRVVYTASACLGQGIAISDGATSMPLGCANALNLQGMVANPNELIDAPFSDTVETDPAIGAITRYRTGQITPLIENSTTGE